MVVVVVMITTTTNYSEPRARKIEWACEILDCHSSVDEFSILEFDTVRLYIRTNQYRVITQKTEIFTCHVAQTGEYLDHKM